ncbi:ribosomal protein S18 acetylase RimI-like enzyme [Dysgonomonas hofstadii]|uniref:Ribosomal protein S18 acetylase RimI-like enzyme n=1 Tax=Dysgonomonas hofstadii TaxID=637886 RepID=A0A840CKC6_9BACT|nr:GNAT family N-acetyltransferase [Dysgonomonas hofstadii]MBB4035816.1 ribosomal protein S18 acetylase RimI-like enzyme [Dysgonomonas hofstadii]
MNLRYRENCNNISWERVAALLQEVDMSFTTPEIHRVSFEVSYAVIFVFDENKMIGMGRILSDGVRQSAMYDIAVDPYYQGFGIGQEIVKRLLEKTPGCNCILYASPGKEGFYRKLGFKKMKTGMVLFSNPERMADDGFVEE